MTDSEPLRRPPADESRRARVRLLAGWLDDRFTIPGTRIRFGLDAVLGLLPAGGDAATAVVASWIVGEALAAGAPTPLVARMLGRVLLDLLVGVVPILGDVADVGYRANRRNARDLVAFLEGDQRPARRSRAWVVAAVGLLLAALGGLLALAWWSVSALVSALG
ncbi:MAG: DUF4112 domain-containing protein [Myxococcota bacterium]